MKLDKIVGDVQNKNILLLQGPMGSYFNTLDERFTKNGANVFRIGFNAGDEYFAKSDHYTGYKDTPENWPVYIKDFLLKNNINKLFVFGDCRFYQKHAIAISKGLNIEVFVFEEGYLRPNFITLEKYGVNDNSTIPRDRKFYDNLNIDNEIIFEMEHLEYFGSTYGKMARQATLYYFLGNFFHYKYPNYHHHRCFSFFKEGWTGIKNYFRKNINIVKEKNLNQYFEKELDKKYYFVPLQTYNDFQLRVHSNYNSIEEFIKEVLMSFSKFAPGDKYLVFKHHPMDRGKKNYKKYIMFYAKQYGIKDRVVITWDVHLPTLLKHSIGSIMINSTVGIQSLYHKTPTICLGRAIYDIEGLTCKDMSLDDFWNNYKEVDYDLFKKFRGYLIQTTQINSNFYL